MWWQVSEPAGFLVLLLLLLATPSFGSQSQGSSENFASSVSTTSQRNRSTEDLVVIVAELQKQVSSLHERNFALEKRIEHLESCECRAASCLHKGVTRQSGESFHEGNCTTCQCQNGQMKCIVNRSTPECQDFCNPNPCQHGGICRPSRWPAAAPERVRCLCLPGFEGPRCERVASFVCGLPRQTGECGNFSQRWHYNQLTRRCEPFMYTGCAGNANNFASYEECQQSCVMGSCCYRLVRQSATINQTYGFSRRGYDKYGYTANGYDSYGSRQVLSLDTVSHDHQYRFSGFDWQGFDANGFNRDGVDRQGYDRDGYHVRTGYNRHGFDRMGIHDRKPGYDKAGLDSGGYARDGYNCAGIDENGYDTSGLFATLDYKCDYMHVDQCRLLETDRPTIEVIRFDHGKQCSDACGSAERHGGRCSCASRSELFSAARQAARLPGCDALCRCSAPGTSPGPRCIGKNATIVRKEVRDMEANELLRYRSAVAKLNSGDGGGARPSAWLATALARASHAPHVHRRHFLPWHRRFLAEMEMALQEVVGDSSLYIPYFDWTIDSSDLAKSTVWRAGVFGGTGDSSTGCVRHNPFSLRTAGAMPDEWSPCLMRQFDKSVVMPNPVVIESVLREPLLEAFEAKLQSISSLFHAFVGGHMATALAAYDPVFLSHYAFLDKLWNEWQSRNRVRPIDVGGGASERYKPMEPFGVPVNSVLLSAEQLCVTYLPVASRCRSSDGDRRPPVTLPTVDQYFDVDGFDADGYDRNGFDVMGYNRQGYYIDGFNADGYDSQGYDRNGYDRHGFGRDGWSLTGVHRNGSHFIRAPNAFDAHGFSRIGLNRHGVDVYGRDASGYDAAGNDVLGCNAYFGWGEHIKLKRRLELELQAMSTDELMRLTRTCTAPVSEPRSWYFDLCWLPAPGRLCWLPSFRQALRPLTSQESSGLWRPQDHGSRFCVAISWIAGCRVGEEASEEGAPCGTDLCSGARCSGHATASCWVINCGGICRRRWTYRGQVVTPQCLGCLDAAGIERSEGSKWQPVGNGCEVCTCESGVVYCVNMTCPPSGCSHPVLPGTRYGINSTHCCPVCRGCQLGDVVYSNGATFAHPSEPCRECRCRWGNVTCGNEQTAQCPALLGCRLDAIVTLPGGCCPVCSDCGSRRDGERWRNDSCVECTCQQGRTVCRRLKCDRDCTHPVLTDGECCPKCTDCLYKGSIYRNGGVFQLSESCEQCQCYEGNVRCDELPCPPLRCQRPLKAERGQCCPRCPDGCEYRGKAYTSGTRFIPDHNHCLECACLADGSVKCGRLTCPDVSHLPCQRPAVLPGQCCPSFCPKCHYLGQDYEHGDRWLPAGRPCEVCVCYEGEISCRSTKTCATSCTHGTYADGECCSPCTDCSFEGSVIADGRSFTRAAGGKCYDCSCSRGTVACVENSRCPELPCTVTETVPGNCCPVCKGCRDELGGVHRRYGEEWYEANPGQCERICACIEGIVRCRQKECPPLSCRFPEDRPGSCCPVCTECTAEGRTYRSGESFTSRLDPCRSCLCENGTVTCSSMSCPTVSCSNPVRPEGRCCPVCPVGQCKHRDITLTDGQRMEDGCDECQCAAGRVTCRRKLCQPPTCNHPKPGACCLECHDCLFNGAIVTHGASVQQDSDPCSVCTCRRGDITCSSRSRTCPAISCQHPYNDTCCPACHHCVYEGEVRSQGETFTSKGDSCQTCICNSGNVNCSPKPCPNLTCPHPTKKLGECCGRCTDCLYRGRTISDGSRFVDGCQECHCSAGVTLCRRTQCEPVACSHPVEGECCPTCTDCLYNATRVAEGMTFRRPDDDCQTCTCSAGSVACSSKACLPATCSHPVQSHCGCAECSGCSYNDRLYADDEVFYDRENRCSVCRCRGGTVSCQPAGCGQAASCTDPDYDECGCPVCLDCIRDGHRIPNGSYVNATALPNVDPCMRCRCQDGTVSCSAIECREPSCANPGRGLCGCRECDGCSYGGSERRNGESFEVPEDACRMCQCTDGTVTCITAMCRLPVCSHPAPGPCCPTCAKCLYNGLIYDDGANFTADNGCSNCACKEGSVVCNRRRCVRPSCPFVESSETTANGCCDSCQGCLINGVRHAHASMWTSGDCGESCSCHGGVVTCSSVDCVTPCASPLRIPDLHCCPLCPGCSLGGRRYGDGERFQHPTDPCVHCQCLGGNLACMRQSCPSTDGCPSDQLLPPDDGQCCATCLVAFNESCGVATAGLVVRPSSDPCFVCACVNEHWTCSKVHCPPPALPCDAPGGLLHVSGECCPVCPVCLHKGARYDDGATWIDPDEPCSACACERGRSICRDKAVSCPLLGCGPGTRAAVRPGECCAVCLDATLNPLQPVESSCRDGDRTYESGEHWRVDECTSCECSTGEAVCVTDTCADPRCASDEVATLLPGVCCPQCIKQPATCIAYGDPHYRTFDGDTVHFQGFCRYTMAADCVGRKFSVETEHDHRNTSSVSWVYSVTVRVNDSVEIKLSQGGGVEVGGLSVGLPYLLEPLVSIELRGGVTLLNTAVGLKVHWDGSSHVEVKVSGDYKGRTCGLCGNFNNFPQDDMRTRQGTVTASPAVFGNSWRVKGSAGSADCQDATDVDPCAQAGYHAKRNAAAKCSVLMGNQFSKCHRVIPPDAYYSSCTYDMCACYDHQSLKGSSGDCLCDVLSTYASACSQAGVVLNWRTTSLCSIDCDVSKGFVFDDCGPPCPRTCANHDRLPGQMEPHCYRPCVPSCQCPAGRVLHSGRCVSPTACSQQETSANASTVTP